MGGRSTTQWDPGQGRGGGWRSRDATKEVGLTIEMRLGPTTSAREEGGWRDEGAREVESAVLWSSVERSWDGTQRKAAESAALEVGAGIEATVTRRTVQRVIASIPFFRWTMRGNRPGWSAGPGRHVQTEGRPHQIPYLLGLISLTYQS